jgi:hypothetical protein
MERRARIALGFGLALAALAAMARDFPLVEILLVFLAIFFVVWGRASRGTEALISQLPGGKYVLKALEQIDLILSPRDREHDQHIRETIIAYSPELRASSFTTDYFTDAKFTADTRPTSECVYG